MDELGFVEARDYKFKNYVIDFSAIASRDYYSGEITFRYFEKLDTTDWIDDDKLTEAEVEELKDKIESNDFDIQWGVVEYDL